MRDEVSIVDQYAGSDIPARVEILIKYYPNFMGLIEGYEQNLSFIIKQEKEYARQQHKGELGVRIQTSGISDPTAKEAIENVAIIEAIKSGSIEAIRTGLEEEIISQYERELAVLKDLKEDHQILKNAFFYLNPDDKAMFERYLAGGNRSQSFVDELDKNPEAVRTQVSRMKQIVVSHTKDTLRKKYRRKKEEQNVV